MDMYEVLGVPRDAGETDIRQAYLRLIRRLHPDRNDSATAQDEFGRVREAYLTLVDAEKRREYDATGTVSVKVVRAPTYASVCNEMDIVRYKRQYRFSEEEKADVARWHAAFGGDMDLVLKYVPFATAKDKSRFVRMVGA